MKPTTEKKGLLFAPRVQAAAQLLGRDSVAVEERHIKRKSKAEAQQQRLDRVRAQGEAVGDGCVVLGAGASAGGNKSGDGGLALSGSGKAPGSELPLAFGGTKPGGAGGASGKKREWGAAVMRIDTSALPKPKEAPKRKRVALDEDNRWKTEARIQAGGTGGQAEMNALRRAARSIETGNTRDGGGDGNGGRASYLCASGDGDDDGAPVLVAPEELEFDEDGWSKGSSLLGGAPAAALLDAPQPGRGGDVGGDSLRDSGAGGDEKGACWAAGGVAADTRRAEEKAAAEFAAAVEDVAAAEEAAEARRVREAAKRARLQAELAVAESSGGVEKEEEIPEAGGDNKTPKPGSKKKKAKQLRTKATASSLLSFGEEDD